MKTPHLHFTKNWSLLLLLFIGACLIIMLFKALQHNPLHRSSALLNQKIPRFQAQTLENSALTTEQVFSKNPLTLLHFWGSWCGYCQHEYAQLGAFALESQIPWVGIAFRDQAELVKRLLSKGTNPYSQVVLDPQGKIAIDFGVTGAPETFLIDQELVVHFHYQGPITSYSWQQEILPAIQAIHPKSRP